MKEAWHRQAGRLKKITCGTFFKVQHVQYSEGPGGGLLVRSTLFHIVTV